MESNGKMKLLDRSLQKTSDTFSLWFIYHRGTKSSDRIVQLACKSLGLISITRDVIIQKKQEDRSVAPNVVWIYNAAHFPGLFSVLNNDDRNSPELLCVWSLCCSSGFIGSGNLKEVICKAETETDFMN